MQRLRISEQLEKSAAVSVVVTGTDNKQKYLPVGANDTILTVEGGVPVFKVPATQKFTITDGTTSQEIENGDTLTVTQSNGIEVSISSTDILTLAARLSSDANNDLVFGSDGGLYISKNNLLQGARWDDETNSLILEFESGSEVSVPITDDVSSWLADFELVGNTGAGSVDNHGTITIVGSNGLKTTVLGSTITISGEFLNENQTVSTGLSTGNTVTLPSTPNKITNITRNGMRQLAGAGADYQISGAIITFSIPFGNSVGGAAANETVIVDWLPTP